MKFNIVSLGTKKQPMVVDYWVKRHFNGTRTLINFKIHPCDWSDPKLWTFFWQISLDALFIIDFESMHLEFNCENYVTRTAQI